VYIPKFAAPVSGARQENITPEWVASHPIDGGSVTVIGVQICFSITFAASIHSGFLSTGQVDVRLTFYKFEAEPGCLSKIDAFILAFFLGWVVLPLKIHQVLLLKKKSK
jgi:hypothetical protein